MTKRPGREDLRERLVERVGAGAAPGHGAGSTNYSYRLHQPQHSLATPTIGHVPSPQFVTLTEALFQNLAVWRIMAPCPRRS